MLPPAVRPDWTGIVGVMAKLANVLDHEVEAVGVALAQLAPAGVVRAPPAQPDRAITHVGTACALLAKAIVFELKHRREGEGVI